MQGPIDTNELATFLREANVNTYANKSAAKAPASRLGSEDYHFERGDLIFHDTYFGISRFHRQRDHLQEPETSLGNELLWRDCLGTDR